MPRKTRSPVPVEIEKAKITRKTKVWVALIGAAVTFGTFAASALQTHTPPAASAPTVMAATNDAAELERRLDQINVVLAGPDADQKRIAAVRSWLRTDPGYQQIANTVVRLVHGRRFADPIHLDTLHGKVEDLKRKSHKGLSDSLLTAAVLTHWNEMHPGAEASALDDIVVK